MDKMQDARLKDNWILFNKHSLSTYCFVAQQWRHSRIKTALDHVLLRVPSPGLRSSLPSVIAWMPFHTHFHPPHQRQVLALLSTSTAPMSRVTARSSLEVSS